MLSAIKKIQEQKRLHKNIFALLAEMEKNLELFYVMDQRQFITAGFLADAWPQVKEAQAVKRHDIIRVYAEAISDFNSSFKAYKEFEAWYTSDLKHKTPDNAKKLHSLKHDLDRKLKGMEVIIIPAGQALEKEMLEMGLLKS